MRKETQTKEKVINSPQCQKETIYSLKNEWRPFCSERCYRIDLGAWANESYRISAKEEDPNEEERHQSL